MSSFIHPNICLVLYTHERSQQHSFSVIGNSPSPTFPWFLYKILNFQLFLGFPSNSYSVYNCSGKILTDVLLKPIFNVSAAFRSVLWRCWLGNGKGIRPTKKSRINNTQRIFCGWTIGPVVVVEHWLEISNDRDFDICVFRATYPEENVPIQLLMYSQVV